MGGLELELAVVMRECVVQDQPQLDDVIDPGKVVHRIDTEEELNDEIELLHRQNLPTKVRQRTKKDGGEELVLYVKQADRDYARYCTGWRPGGMM
jgi:hypothetical protein